LLTILFLDRDGLRFGALPLSALVALSISTLINRAAAYTHSLASRLLSSFFPPISFVSSSFIMVVSIVTPLAKRAVAVGVKCMHRMSPGFPDRRVPYSVPVTRVHPKEDDIVRRLKNPMSILTLALTGLAFLLVMTAIEYAVRIVALNLAIVESPESSGSIKLPLDGDVPSDAKAPLLDDYDDAVPTLSAKPKPVTASLCSTMSHLNKVGGFFSRFRGAHFGVFYGVCYGLIYTLLTSLFGFFGPLGILFSIICTSAATCNLRAAWTHATIAAPSDKRFFQRFLPRETAKKLIAPNVRAHLSVVLTQVVTFVTVYAAKDTVQRFGLNWLSINVFLLPIASTVGMVLFVYLPCQIALIQREASLLPEDADCIVPFDRTFNGTITWDFETRKEKFVHLAAIRGAWRSVDKTMRKRVVTVLAKLVGISIATGLFFGAVVSAELFVIVGKSNLIWAADQIHSQL
jgi:hypothetical protein